MGNERDLRSENNGKPRPSRKPIGQGDPLEDELGGDSTERRSGKSVPYGDMDQPGMNPDMEDDEH